MTDPPLQTGAVHRLAPRLAGAVAVGFALRVAAGVAVGGVTARLRPPRLCIFPDADIYWALAHTLRTGAAYQVSQWGVPHYALRTPGYPLFLAACQSMFGGSPVAVRMVQAGLGAACVWLAFRLFERVAGADSGGRSLALWGAVLVAVEPYTVALSALILSEALFVPLMLLALWGGAGLWETEPGPRDRPWLALATGLAAGGALLARPSWALFIPVWLAAWPVFSRGSARGRACRGALLVALGIMLAMAPWWVRNARLYGRFVPTALWVGPSLYDGLNPRATGASDMEFLAAPDLRVRSESDLDTELRLRSWAFARAHPDRAIRLALVKAGRFWSPWPNAEAARSMGVAAASALVTLPIFSLVLLGVWDRRRDPRALVLLGGTLAVFWALHMLFVGSVRYRIPGMVPAMGLAAFGARGLLQFSGHLGSARHLPMPRSTRPDS